MAPPSAARGCSWPLPPITSSPWIPATGKTRWQYERETPEGFTIHGNAVPLQHGPMVYAGFSDGYLAALQAESGDLLWSRSLAAASDQFVDVDASPIIKGDKLFAASFSGGLYALRPKDGEVVWHLLIDGINALAMGASNLYAMSSREGLAAISPAGQHPLAPGFARAGDLTVPWRSAPISCSAAAASVSSSSIGAAESCFRSSIRRAACARRPPSIAKARALYVLANSGTLYALDLLW